MRRDRKKKDERRREERGERGGEERRALELKQGIKKKKEKSFRWGGGTQPGSPQQTQQTTGPLPRAHSRAH